jgi:hypothetical protein
MYAAAMAQRDSKAKPLVDETDALTKVQPSVLIYSE